MMKAQGMYRCASKLACLHLGQTKSALAHDSQAWHLQHMSGWKAETGPLI